MQFCKLGLGRHLEEQELHLPNLGVVQMEQTRTQPQPKELVRYIATQRTYHDRKDVMVN
jgi:hypothetical protein